MLEEEVIKTVSEFLKKHYGESSEVTLLEVKSTHKQDVYKVKGKVILKTGKERAFFLEIDASEGYPLVFHDMTIKNKD